MKYMIFACVAAAAIPATAHGAKPPSTRASLGSARTVADIQACLAPKLIDLGAPVITVAAPTTRLVYGQGKSQVIVEITEDGDVRSVNVVAGRKLGKRQEDIRSCMY